MIRKKDDGMREDKLGAIFRAAASLFSTRGFERTSVDEIAAQANVAKGTIFYHYKSKDDLFRRMYERGVSQLTRAVEEALAVESDPLEALCAVVRIQTTLIHANPEFFRIVLAEIWGDQERQQALREALNRYFTLVKDLAAEGIRQGRIRTVTPTAIADMVFGMTAVASLRLLFSPQQHDLEAVIGDLQSFLRIGIAANPEEA
jgi:TetR/AcrR family transcriptional regulator